MTTTSSERRDAGDGAPGGGREAVVVVVALLATFGVLAAGALAAMVLVGAFLGATAGASSRPARGPAPAPPPAAVRPTGAGGGAAALLSGLVLPRLEGGDADLGEPLRRGRPFVIAVWLPGCADCVPSIPDLDRLLADVRERDVFALAAAFGGTPERTAPDVAGTTLGPHVILDRDGVLTNGLGIGSFTVIVFDGAGHPRWRGGPPFSGALDALDACLADERPERD